MWYKTATSNHVPCPSACGVSTDKQGTHYIFLCEVVLPNRVMDCSTYLSFLGVALCCSETAAVHFSYACMGKELQHWHAG